MNDRFSIIVPLLRPKYKSAARGSFVVSTDKLYFQSGKNIVYIREHFSDKNVSPERLIEATIRYERETQNTVENEAQTCYNGRVNDVL